MNWPHIIQLGLICLSLGIGAVISVLAAAWVCKRYFAWLDRQPRRWYEQ